MISHLIFELVRMKIFLIFILCALTIVKAAPGFGSSEERFGFGFGGGDFSSESFSHSRERFYPVPYGGGYNGPFRAFPFANRQV